MPHSGGKDSKYYCFIRLLLQKKYLSDDFFVFYRKLLLKVYGFIYSIVNLE